MKVILIKDVARLGRRSEVKDVPSGHALNFLIPRKLAIVATPESLKRLTEESKKHDEQKEVVQKAFEEALHTLTKDTIKYPVEANEKGSLFKGINAEDIVRQLATVNIFISKNDIILAHPIKEIGVHEIQLHHNGTRGVFKLDIIKK